jgi:hypothetical protein
MSRFLPRFVPARSLAAFASAMLLFLPVSPAAAQHASRLNAGAVVRLHSPRIVPAQPLVARLDTLTADSVVFRYESGGMLQPSRALPVGAVSRLEVQVREPVRHGGTKGLLIGAAAGGLLGWGLGRLGETSSTADCAAGPCISPGQEGAGTALLAVLGTATGSAVGWWVGRHWKARRWREVPLR